MGNKGLNMLAKVKRLFIIKTRFEACLIIYALGLGAIERGIHYLDQYPGYGGYMLLTACTGSVSSQAARFSTRCAMKRRKLRRCRHKPALTMAQRSPHSRLEQRGERDRMNGAPALP